MIIAVDFDGTIVDHRFPEIGPFIPGAIDYLKEFKENGATLILWTMRSDGGDFGDVLTQAVSACEGQGVIFDNANQNPQTWTTSPKAYAHVYIDDAAFGCPLKMYDFTRQPCVDWSIVGPSVLKLLKRPF